MVSSGTLISYPYWKIPFTVHNDDSDKELGAVISQNNKPIALFSRILSKPQHNYITIDKELLTILECLKQLRGILFGYEINVFSDHKNLFNAATLSESQRVMHWGLILEEFGPNIQNIAVVYSIVADTLSRFPSTPSNKYESCTRKYQCHAKKLFVLGRVENNDDCFPLNILIVQTEQQK